MNDIKHQYDGLKPYGARHDSETETEKFIDLEKLLGAVRRQARVVALCAFIGLLIGVAKIVFSTYYYTAATSILLDENLNRFANEVSPAPASMQTDTTVASEVAILQSSALASKIVEKEKLYEDDKFLNVPVSFTGLIKDTVGFVLSMFTGVAPAGIDYSDPAVRRELATAILLENVSVERQGRSLVIDVTYTSTDPAFAARITNAYASGYLSDQVDAHFDAARNAGVWLQERLADLKTRSQNAALEVEKFRAENGLTAAKGALVSEQQLSDINSQFILAQADTAQAMAQYRHFKSIIDSGPENVIGPALALPEDTSGASTGIGELKTEYLQASKRLQEITSQFGPSHPQAALLTKQIRDINTQMFEEIRQLTEGYRNRYEIALAREQSLKESLGRITGDTSVANEALVRLRELEQNAEVLSTLYQGFLTRYQDTYQRQSFPAAKARVISVAGIPGAPSSPKRKAVIALSLLLGLFCGGAIAAVRELRDNSFRTGQDIRNTLGARFLGYLPTVENPAILRPKAGGEPGGVPAAASVPQFAATLRHAKLTIDASFPSGRARVIGVISALPHEGRSMVAANLATLLASSGANTLLIDGDLAGGALSSKFGLEKQPGLSESLSRGDSWLDIVRSSSRFQLSILPSGPRGEPKDPSDILASRQMKTLIGEARERFEYVIVDLPPLVPGLEATMFEPAADGFLLVTEWGVTPRLLVKSTLEAESRIHAKLLGVILNKVDTETLATYTPSGSPEYFLGAGGKKAAGPGRKDEAGKWLRSLKKSSV